MGGPTRVNRIILGYSVHTLISVWEKPKGLAHLGEYTEQMEMQLDQTFPGARRDLSET